MNNKYIYLINNREVSRTDFKNFIAINVCCKYQSIGVLGVNIADYDEAEKIIKKYQATARRYHSLIGVVMAGNFQIKYKK